MTHRVLNMHKVNSIIHIKRRHCRQSSVAILLIATMALWRHASYGQQVAMSRIDYWIFFMTSLYIYYALCFVHVEHSVCHEPISVLINIFTLLAQCLLSTLLVQIITMRELRRWPSIGGMSPQSHCGDEEDGCIGLFLWRHYILYII